MSTWLTSSLAATAAALVVALVYFYLSWRYHERPLNTWAWAWVVVALHNAVPGFHGDGPGLHLELIPGLLLALVGALLLALGTLRFLQAQAGWLGSPLFQRSLRIGALVAAGWAIAGVLLRLSFFWFSLPTYVLICAIFLITGSALLRAREIVGAGQHIAGWAFILWAVSKLAYPLVAFQPVYRDGGFLVSAAAGLLIAFGIFLAYFERARKDLAASQARYRAIVQDQTDLIRRIHPDGSFSFVNQAYCRFFGVTESQLLGRNLFDFEPASSLRQRLASLTQGAPMATTEVMMHTREGIRWLQWTDRGVFDEQGQLVEIQSVGHDITGIKQGELMRQAALAVSQAALRSGEMQEVFRAIHEAVAGLMQVPNFYIALYDAVAGRISFPYYVDECDTFPPWRPVGRGMTEYVISTGRPVLADTARLTELIRSGQVTMRGMPALSYLGVPLHNASGAVTGVIAVQSYKEDVRYTDLERDVLSFVASEVGMVIERAQVERALRESENKFRQVFQNAGDAIFLLQLQTSDDASRFLEVNDSACRLLGYSREELLALPPAELDDSLVRLATEGASGLAGQSSATLSGNMRAKDGSPRPVETSIHWFELEGRPVALAIARDISERLAAEQQLHIQGWAIRSASSAIALADLNGRLTMANPSCLRLWGFKDEQEAIGLPAEYLWQDRRKAFEAFRQLLEHGAFTGEVLAKRRDGSTFQAEMAASVVRDEDGRPICLMASVLDVTERVQALEAARQAEAAARQAEGTARQAEAALRQMSEELQAIIQASPVAIFTLDSEQRLLTWNAAAERIFGWASDEIIGQPVPLVPPDGRRDFAASWAKATAGATLGPYEVRALRKDGTPIDISVSMAPASASHTGQASVLIVAADISEHKRLEQQFIQAQKMETVGQLAGGIAHDFNNLLTAITGHAYFALNALPADDPIRADMEQVLKAAKRAAELTRQLLTFSRRQVMQPTLLNLSDLVADLEQMLHRLIPEQIELVAQTEAAPWLVKADPSQIQQALANLTVNARDAIIAKGGPGAKGRIVIETKNIVIDEDYSNRQMRLSPGEYVRLSVSDTGIGMPPQVLQHAFEPFFTTKDVGQGSGLGLATVYGIVKDHQGDICIYSEPGQGTVFHIYLPRARETEGQLPPAPSNPMPEGAETVLLAEDESAVRVVMQRTLERLGYKVLPAEDGAAALRAAEAYKGEIHLLLSDMVMPNMTGPELAERLKASRPALKVLFSSGYPSDTMGGNGPLQVGANFLQKPFTGSALALKVREVLDAPMAAAPAEHGRDTDEQ